MRAFSRERGAIWAVLPLVLWSCVAARPPLPSPQLQPEPSPDEVERILFLLGDPGEGTTATSPVLQRLQRDVEEWSGRLETDSAVAVLILGDIVYPTGLNSPQSPRFAQDTAVVMSQVRLVSGPNALERKASAYFLPGNHDWGLREDFAGVVRLNRLDQLLESVRRDTGAEVRLLPEPGSGGPWVWDWGLHVRLLLLDTAWWLLRADGEEETAFLEGIEEAMRTAGNRQVLLAAHHPFRAAGPHAGEGGFWNYLGLYSLLRNAGVLLQDLNSRPYRALQRGLREIFARTGPPLAFIGGHEHSLHLMERVEPTDPRYSIVSGSGSKLSGVGWQEGLRFGRSAPGYMRMLIGKDGGVHLTMVATRERYLLCPERDPERHECMVDGAAAFEAIHSQPLR